MKLLRIVVALISLIAGVAFADGEMAVTTGSGLQYIDTVVGEGAIASKGDTVSVQYTGWVQQPDGSKGIRFDTSREIGRPLEFRLGARKVIQGWDEGIVGMHVGGKRTLMIPTALAYGKHGLGHLVLPNQNLIFEVELVGIRTR